MTWITKRRSRTPATMTRMAALAALTFALASTRPSVEALAFDALSSRSSSTFGIATCSNSQLPAPSSTSSTSASTSLLTMKVSGGAKRNRSSKSSHLIELNNERLKIAGRPGTKNFVDPNKVFLGNLPYDATEDDVTQLFATHWNVPHESVGDRIESVKIVRDWKTGQSKGYGFLQFYEPMVATSAMESINKGVGKGWRIRGRRIRLDQGKRKPEEDMREKKKKKKQEAKKLEMEDLDEEGRVIHSVLEDVEGMDGASAAAAAPGMDGATAAAAVEEEDEEEDGMMSEDDMITFMEKGGLRGVMPLTEETAGFLGIEGLYDEDDDEGYDTIDDFEEYYTANGYDDADFDEATLDENDEDDDEEDDGEEIKYDGVFEEEYNPNEYEGLSKEEEEEMKAMNREQRRAAEKRRKKRKLPFRGFGSQP